MINGLGLIGKKVGMSQIFSEDGNIAPVTIVEAGPCTVVNVKKESKDGYNSLQLGFEDIKEDRLNKPTKGYFNKNKVKPKRILLEFRTEHHDSYRIGDEMKVDLFSPGDKVDVTGISKGKGFQGVIKRWGFHGGPASHGAQYHRSPGAIGACATPSRVHKGKKLPGHMGARRRTVLNLEVVKVIPENSILVIKGSVPGNNKSTVLVRKAVKKKKAK